MLIIGPPPGPGNSGIFRDKVLLIKERLVRFTAKLSIIPVNNR